MTTESAPTKKPKQRYRTTNWSEYDAALKARGSFMIWLDKDMQWFADPSGENGRPQRYTDAAIQFCLSIKCLYNLAGRQNTGMVQSLLKLANLDWEVPNHSTISRRQSTLKVQIGYQKRNEPLHLLVDSTGIKFLGEGEWKRKKHGAEYRRQWRKVHLAIDAETLEIRAIEVTDNSVGDAPMLPELIAQIPANEVIASATLDGAYDTRDCYRALTERRIVPIIPPRKNAKRWKSKTPGSEIRNAAIEACERFGRRIWKKWSGYHRRSLVETKMHCFKRLGERVMAKTFDRQVAELQVRAALLNRFTALGSPKTVAVSVVA
jgi:hypothetical protein